MNCAQHTQRQAVDFKQAKDVDIGFIPLDDGPLGHGGIFDRHQIAQGFVGDHKAPGMLGQMTGKTDQLLDKCQYLAQHRSVWVKTDFLYVTWYDLIVLPPDTVSGETLDLILRQTQRLPDIAYRAAGAVSDHCAGQCGPVSSVAPVDILHDFLAPLVLKVHINVRRLVTLT